MAICWYCHWGWPEPNAAIYEKYLPLIGESGLDFGPGHIVWSDENFNTDCIQFCIDNIDKYSDGLTEEEKGYALASLKELLAIPEDIRDCCPSDYDDENPENYPPPANVTMVKKGH